MIVPIPPIWIRARIHPRPNKDQLVAVSLTTSPVTQTAEVAVNRASLKCVMDPSREETGSIRRIVPVRIMARKLPIMI